MTLADIDECKERTFCQCKDCSCENTWGSYECGCGGNNMLYMREHDTCISEFPNLNFVVALLHGSVGYPLSISFISYCTVSVSIPIVWNMTMKFLRQGKFQFKLYFVFDALIWRHSPIVVQVKLAVHHRWAGASSGLFSLASVSRQLGHMQFTSIGYG